MLPDGIDEVMFAASLRVIGHPWRPGQRCKVTDVTCRHFDQAWFDTESEETKRWVKEGGQPPPFAEHDIPIPAVTDELLMRMLEKSGPSLVARFYERMPARPADDNRSLYAAIIRTTAALDKEG
jgi:hypothetical protein